MNAPLLRTVAVRCSVDHAFDVFTARVDLWWPRGHRRFSRSTLSLEPRVGGRFLERADDGTEVRLGDVVACEPPHRIVYTWFPGAVRGPTTVEVRFLDDGGHADGPRTTVEVTHREGESELGPAWPERAKRFIDGWGAVLPALADFIAHERREP